MLSVPYTSTQLPGIEILIDENSSGVKVVFSPVNIEPSSKLRIPPLSTTIFAFLPPKLLRFSEFCRVTVLPDGIIKSHF
ncbi:hypothetical protein DSECCO2_615380 [anaerobic digester metagenome]